MQCDNTDCNVATLDIVDCLSAANTKQNDLRDEDTCLWVIEITKK